MTTWNIKKTDEDRYHVSSCDLIDEEVDGSQLMGMLVSRGLTEAQARDILFSLDPKEIGYSTSIAFNHN